jgi:CheY-like chemotaxis protein
MFRGDGYSDTTFVIERNGSTNPKGSMVPSKTLKAAPDAPRDKCWRGLVVDDAPEFRKSAGMALSTVGGQITTAVHGAEAVEIVRIAAQCGLGFDIVFTDIQMPVMDGIEATRLMRAGGFDGPIVAISGSEDSRIADECLQAGCSEFVRKPVGFETLEQIVLRHLPKFVAAAIPQIAERVHA